MTSPDFAPTVYQSFDIRTSPDTVAKRVKALRAAMRDAGVDAFLVPRTDAHRGESVPASEARLAYVTSFTGSAGMAIIGARKAGLFVDGRYTLQAPAETDTKVIEVVEAVQGGISARIADFVSKGGKVGFDPWLHTPAEIADFEKKFADKAVLVPVANLVDKTWDERPAPPNGPVEFLGHNRAGQTAPDKLVDIRASMAADDADALVLTVPESINWLFNLRGRDVPNTPVLLAFALVPKAGQPTLFVEKQKISDELLHGLEGLAKVADVATMVAALKKLGKGNKRVLIDPVTVPVAVADAIRGAGSPVVIEKRDPVVMPKAKKNDAELGGMREAHRIDGVAMAKFLHWFDKEAPKGELDEIAVATALESFRREESSLVDVSFDTISGAGSNGAIIHYRVNRKTNRRLKPGELMLVDSGAQYLSGTTDITRTMSTGKVTKEQVTRYTQVLRGMIAISRVRFPRGTNGAQLDVLARQFLWADGVTYNHGTGHGVGAFLAVHEGPIGISPRYSVPFEAGMITSNEPGFYKEGAFGIRIENLLHVVESDIGDGKFLEFETLTLAPIDTRLIDVDALSGDERSWLNAYHKRVYKEIGPQLKGKVKDWLKDATREI